MRKDKDAAISLRKNGLSYSQIASRLTVSKSTLSRWFSEEPWSVRTKAKLEKINMTTAAKNITSVINQMRVVRREIYESRRNWARQVYDQYKNQPLFIGGLMLYWGEGDNKLENGQIRICNSKPEIVRMFHVFLNRYLPGLVDKIKAYLILYPDLDEISCLQHWSNVTNIPLDKFFKSQYIIGRSSKRTIPYGIGTLIVSSRAEKEVITTWIECVRQDIINSRV